MSPQALDRVVRGLAHAVLSITTLVTHSALGHIDWAVAAAFAGGTIPGAFVGSRAEHLVGGESVRRAFGLLLIGFAIYFTATQVVGA